MATMQSVIDTARLDLNDDDKVRHTDTTLLLFANNYLQEVSKNRPDLYFPDDPPESSLALGATFPLSDKFIRPCADYVIGRANLRGTEESRIDVAAAYMQMSATTSGVR